MSRWQVLHPGRPAGVRTGAPVTTEPRTGTESTTARSGDERIEAVRAGAVSASLLEVPEIGAFHALYLHNGLPEVLFWVPQIDLEHFASRSRGTADGLMAAVRASYYYTLSMVE